MLSWPGVHEIILFLHPPPNRPIYRPVWYFPLCFSSVVFASALRSRKLRLLCTVPIIALFSQFHIIYAAEPKSDYPVSLWLMWIFFRYIDISLLGANDKMWLSAPSKPKSDDDNSEARAEMREYLRKGSLVERIRKSMFLWFTLRGIGWNWEIKHLKLHRGSRSSFLFFALVRLLAARLCMSFMFYMRWRLPYTGPIPSVDLSQAPAWAQLILSGLAIVSIYTELTYIYWLFAVVLVGLGIHKAEEWPFLFGHASEAYTVGQAWSRTWHQSLRRVCTFLVDPVAGFLGVKKKTSLHRNITLVIGFTVSGLIHYAGTCNLPYSPNHERYFVLFLSQPLAIMFEDFMMAVGRRLGIKPSRKIRIFGYVWTMCWLLGSIRAFLLRTSLEDMYPIEDTKWIDDLVGYFEQSKAMHQIRGILS